MGIENERKLLIRTGVEVASLPQRFPFLAAERYRDITQGYLGGGVRVRRSNYDDGKTDYELAYKAMTTIGLIEVEPRISREEYQALLAEKAEGRVLRKRRSSFRCARTGLLLEVDAFPTGDASRPRFTMAEIEFDSEHAFENLRDDIGEVVFHEVAQGDRTFENARLATPDGMARALARLDELGLAPEPGETP